MTLTGPDGDHTAFGIAPVSGSRFQQFDVLFAPLTAAGSYTVVIGPNVRDLYGNTADVFTTTFSIAGPRVSDATIGTALPVDHVQVTFDRSMDTLTFSTDSFVLVAPDGSMIAITGVTAVPLSYDSQFEVDFTPSSAVGNYTFTVRAGVADIYGNVLADDITINFTL